MTTAVVIGAGAQGYDAYATHFLAHPEDGRIVAVADPSADRRRRFAERYDLTDDALYDDFDDLFGRDRLADVAIVTTGDALHVAPTLAALERGYHVLLEKPMALSAADCQTIVDAAEASGRIVAICHVYRYTPFFSGLHEVVTSGVLGRVLSIQASENVGYWHTAHSYVRGHTRRGDVSPMLLQKSCHDLDLLVWLAGAPAQRVTSLLRPTELTDANAPEGAPEHCLDGCPHAPTCPYDAAAMYLDLLPMLQDLSQTRWPPGLGPVAGALAKLRPHVVDSRVAALRDLAEWKRWPVTPVSDDTSRAAVTEALRTTRWGRCAWRVGDNDQPAAQTVDVSFTNGVLAGFTLNTSSHRESRQIRIDGTHGSVEGALFPLEGSYTVVDHKSGRRRRVRTPTTLEAHSGGEKRLMVDFLASVRGEREPLTSARESNESHRIAFAAMTSAAEGRAVDLA